MTVKYYQEEDYDSSDSMDGNHRDIEGVDSDSSPGSDVGSESNTCISESMSSDPCEIRGSTATATDSEMSMIETDESSDEGPPLAELKKKAPPNEEDFKFSNEYRPMFRDQIKPEQMHKYYLNRFVGWPLEVKEELLLLRFDIFGDEFREAPVKERIWEKIVERFSDKYPEYQLNTLRARKNLRNYKVQYHKGLMKTPSTRPPNWEVFQKYFQDDEEPEVPQTRTKRMLRCSQRSTKSVNRLSRLCARTIKPETRTWRIEVDVTLIKLRKKVLAAEFESVPRHERGALWNQIATRINVHFNLDIKSREVQDRYNILKRLVTRKEMSPQRRKYFEGYFTDGEEGGERSSEAEDPSTSKPDCKPGSGQQDVRVDLEQIINQTNPRYQEEMREFIATGQKLVDTFVELTSWF